MRVGIGYDVHQLVPGRKLVLGGVQIDHYKGLLGHSDADVLLHALCDALLGAAAAGDIGRHFPDQSHEYKDISSLILLARVKEILEISGYKVVNVDSVIAAQRPRLAPYIEDMRDNIARVLEIPVACVGVKATTTEGLGLEGREEGISAQAIALIDSSGDKI